MKFSTGAAIFLAAAIGLAIAVPARRSYRPLTSSPSSYEEDDEAPGLIAGGQGYHLASAPFYYYQPRNLEVEDRGRKYQIVRKKKKGPGGRPAPGSGSGSGSDEDEDDDEPEDDEDSKESSEEEADEEGGGTGGGDEEEFDTPAMEEMFPNEADNTGTWDDHQGGGQGGGYGGGAGGGAGGSLANLPGGAPAPESGGSLMNMFGFGGGSSEGPEGSSGGGGFSSLFGGGGGAPGGEGPGGPPGGHGGSGGPGGPPPQYRRGSSKRPSRPSRPRPPYQAIRQRSGLVEVEGPEGSQGGAVLYDGYRYIPVRPVQVRLPQREAKKVTDNKPKSNKKSKKGDKPQVLQVPVEEGRGRSLTRAQKKERRAQYVVVNQGPDFGGYGNGRDGRDGFKVVEGANGGLEIWRWQGPGGRPGPLRRRENNRPVFLSSRPYSNSRGNVRFAEEDDY